MEKIHSLIGVFIKKTILLFTEALMLLFIINLGAKVLEFNLIFLKTDWPIDFLLMFLFSFILRYLLILIYDYIRIDWFLLEKLKDNSLLQENSLTKRIAKYNWVKYRLLGMIILYLFLNFSEPIFVVIYYRDGNHKWNGVPGLKILLFFIISCLSCTFVLYQTFKFIS